LIVLPAGTYSVSAYGAAHTSTTGIVITLKARIVNDTTSTTLISGPNAYVNSISTAQGAVVPLQGQFTLSGTTTLEFNTWVSSACDGGQPDSTSEVEVYMDIYIKRIV
jgi:hypothetical protein